MVKTRKTRKVAGVDLDSACFLLVPDAEDTSTWRWPVYVPGNPAKTRNLIGTALHRANETKDVSQTIKTLLCGAAMAHGLRVPEDRPAPVSASEKTTPLDAEDRDMKSVLAEAELASERFLAKIGYGHENEND